MEKQVVFQTEPLFRSPARLSSKATTLCVKQENSSGAFSTWQVLHCRLLASAPWQELRNQEGEAGLFYL